MSAQVISIQTLRMRRAPRPGRVVLNSGLFVLVEVEGQVDVAYVITSLDKEGATRSDFYLEDSLDSGRPLLERHRPEVLGTFLEIVNDNEALAGRILAFAPGSSQLAIVRAIRSLSSHETVHDCDIFVALERGRYSRVMTAMQGRFRQFLTGARS